jgi:hypothetical protein
MSETFTRKLKIRNMNAGRRELNRQAKRILVAEFGKNNYTRK